MNDIKKGCMNFFGKEIDTNKYTIFEFKGWYHHQYGLSLSRDYIKSLNNLDELKEYLSTIYKEIPEFLNYIDFNKIKKDFTETEAQSLDKTLGRDFEECGDDGWGSFVYSNRTYLCSLNGDDAICSKFNLDKLPNGSYKTEIFSKKEVKEFIEKNFEIRNEQGLVEKNPKDEQNIEIENNCDEVE